MNWVYWLSGARRARHLRLSDRRAVQAGDLRMNTSGWLQLGLYVVVLLLLAKPLGRVHGRGLRGPRHARAADRRPARAPDLSRRGRRSGARNGLDDYALAMLWFNLLGGLVVYALQRLQSGCRSIRRRMAAVSPGLVVQHRDELRHQHQLAGLRRREHDELSHADARRSPCRTSCRPRPAWRCWWR